MFKTLQQLARGNIRKYRKHYLIVTIIIFIVSTLVFSSSFITNNLSQMKRSYYLSKYGTWYTRIENIDDETSKGIEVYSQEYFKNKIKQGYVSFQGEFENYQIGHIDKNIYRLCQVKLIKGRKIKNEQEILINQKVAKKYKLQDRIEIAGKTYTIVGIVRTYNQGLPDIYTNLEISLKKDYYSNMSLATDDQYIQFFDEQGRHELELKYQYNPYGYDQNKIHDKVQVATKQLQQSFEFMMITLFALFALTSSSLKKRMKEMALYRGIGMTTRQLMLMVIQENMLLSFLAIASGLLMGVFVSLGYLYFQSKIYHTFIYTISLKNTLLLILMLVSCIFITIIIPIYSSSKNALAGTFDSKKFNYIQVRYKKLKKQTLSSLASRELWTNKRMNICFYVFVLVLSLYGLVYFYQGHPIQTKDQDEQSQVELLLATQEEANLFLKEFPQKDIIINYRSIDEGVNMTYRGIHQSVYELCQIYYYQGNKGDLKGRLPQKSHEIVVGNHFNHVILSKECYPNLKVEADQVTFKGKKYQVESSTSSQDDQGNYLGDDNYEIALDEVKLNEKVMIAGEEYTIVGINENEYYNDSKIYMSEDDLKRFNTSDEYYAGYHWYPIKDVLKVEKFMKKHYKARVYEMVSSEDFSAGLFSTLNIPTHLLILAVAIGFILMMFLNYNHIENNYQDYLMYHIIGLSYREIKVKQLWKSIKMFLYTLIPCTFYELILLRGSIDHYFPIIQLIFLVFIICIFYLCIYNIPLWIVLKTHKNEEIRKEDD